MLFEIGGEQVVRLTELRRNSKALIARLKSARNQQESRLILTTYGEPVAVLQDYQAYQKLLTQLEEAQRQLHLAETRERLRQMKEGEGVKT
jgi:PHD/YefM family antitoxin component YafN of YafNO toxin-antitoxin module